MNRDTESRGTAIDLGLRQGDQVAIPQDGDRGDLSQGERIVTVLSVNEDGTYFLPPDWSEPELVIVYNRSTNTYRWPEKHELDTMQVEEPEVFAQGIGKHYRMYRLVTRE